MGARYFQGEGQEHRGWGVFQLNLISKKVTQCKNAQKMQEIIKYLKKISSLFSLTRHFTKFIFLEQLTAMSQLNMQNMLFFFCFFFLSNHHDTNPLLHLHHFRKKLYLYNYISASINSESSRVIFSFFFFFCLHPVGQTFLYPANFVTI